MKKERRGRRDQRGARDGEGGRDENHGNSLLCPPLGARAPLSLFSPIFQFSQSGDPQPRFHPVNSKEDNITHTHSHKRAFKRRVIASIAMGKEGREQVSLWIKPRLLTSPWR